MTSFESDHLEERALLEMTRELGFWYIGSSNNLTMSMESNEAMSFYCLRQKDQREKAYPFYFINDYDSSKYH